MVLRKSLMRGTPGKVLGDRVGGHSKQKYVLPFVLPNWLPFVLPTWLPNLLPKLCAAAAELCCRI